MTGPQATLLSGGKRLHLQHGPIDLIVGAEGDRRGAFEAARQRFETVLEDLVAELPLLRRPAPGADAAGETARAMQAAVRPLADGLFVTPMAAVAGAVADTVLRAMTRAASLSRAYVNNGGDIALHLTPGERYTAAMAAHDGTSLGQIVIGYRDPVRGIATSGRRGRSLSLGIADSVTVLAARAAQADAAATLIANAVDLPGHPAIARVPACELDEASDLGRRLVPTACGPLDPAEIDTALAAGLARAEAFAARGLIAGASLHLRGASRLTRSSNFTAPERTLDHV